MSVGDRSFKDFDVIFREMLFNEIKRKAKGDLLQFVEDSKRNIISSAKFACSCVKIIDQIIDQIEEVVESVEELKKLFTEFLKPEEQTRVRTKLFGQLDSLIEAVEPLPKPLSQKLINLVPLIKERTSFAQEAKSLGEINLSASLQGFDQAVSKFNSEQSLSDLKNFSEEVKVDKELIKTLENALEDVDSTPIRGFDQTILTMLNSLYDNQYFMDALGLDRDEFAAVKFFSREPEDFFDENGLDRNVINEIRSAAMLAASLSSADVRPLGVISAPSPIMSTTRVIGRT